MDDIANHYTSGELWRRLETALVEDGVDPSNVSLADLAPYDHFHGRGLEATEALADRMQATPESRLLDIGSGFGGPARYIASRFGCHVTGIDLTEEFCDVAKRLTERLALTGRVHIEHGSATAMPFDDAVFDGAYSMNVSMNIADKQGLFREIFRVLRPGAWLALSEIAKGPNEGLQYPTPWAESAASSFLSTPEETRANLEASGFEVVSLLDSLAASASYGERSKAAVANGEKPLHRAVTLVHGATRGASASANSGAGTRLGQVIPIEIFCQRPA